MFVLLLLLRRRHYILHNYMRYAQCFELNFIFISVVLRDNWGLLVKFFVPVIYGATMKSIIYTNTLGLRQKRRRKRAA